ncbi:hypothetical protein SSX86_029849 [Deinandra increscens subsp. villosa]|uniref:Uncharacterized protein n=1 Tax=Deinandra increscens subsp. villosa TaxID=3103831 RepID=A0AAP0GLX3_9ASTR
MENSGDKFSSLIIPNCHHTASQEEKLQSCPFTRESPKDIQSSSSPAESPEQATGIEIVSLPDSFEEYQPSYPHNSTNDAHVAAATKTAAFSPMKVDDNDGEQERHRTVDLANDSDNLYTDPAKSVTENVETGAHQVFVEMPQQVTDKRKRQLPVSVKTQKQTIESSKREAFASLVDRVLKMVGEGKPRGGGDDVEVDFLETAKMRGLTLPRPRWWPAEGFKD